MIAALPRSIAAPVVVKATPLMVMPLSASNVILPVPVVTPADTVIVSPSRSISVSFEVVIAPPTVIPLPNTSSEAKSYTSALRATAPALEPLTLPIVSLLVVLLTASTSFVLRSKPVPAFSAEPVDILIAVLVVSGLRITAPVVVILSAVVPRSIVSAISVMVPLSLLLSSPSRELIS